MIPVVIDSKAFFISLQDIPAGELRDDIEAFAAQQGEAPLFLDSGYEYRLKDGSGRVLTMQEVARFKQIAVAVDKRDVHLDVSQTSVPVADDVPAILEKHNLKVYGHSSYNEWMSDDLEFTDTESVPDLSSYLFWKDVLGIQRDINNERVRYVYTREMNCDDYHSKKERYTHFSWEDGRYLKGYRNHCSFMIGKLSQHYPVLKAYYQEYKSDFNQAGRVLKERYPRYHENNLKLVLLGLIDLEMTLYDHEIDVLQDLSGAHYAGSPQGNKLYHSLNPNDKINPHWAMNSSLGRSLWELGSDHVLPRGDQGYGVAQVKPSLLKAAYELEGLYEAYQDVLPKEKLDSEQARIRTALDPRDSIYAKAMTLDLQLSQFASNPNVMSPVDLKPFIKTKKAAHEFAALMGAQHLVQQPERTQIVKDMISNGGFSGEFMRLFILGDYLGIDPKFYGANTYQSKECPKDNNADSVGWFIKEPSFIKTCVTMHSYTPQVLKNNRH